MFQASSYTILFELQRSVSRSSLQTILCCQCNGIRVGVRGQSGDTNIQGRQKTWRDWESNLGRLRISPVRHYRLTTVTRYHSPASKRMTYFRVLVTVLSESHVRKLKRLCSRARVIRYKQRTKKIRKVQQTT